MELPRDVAGLRDCTYTIDFLWSGGVNGARLFEFANPNGDCVYLCPWENGRLVFAIRQGTRTEQIGVAVVRPTMRTTVRVVLEGNRATLFVNETKAPENNAMTLSPESVRATQCYLGRGLKGGYFSGMINRFTIHSIAVKR